MKSNVTAAAELSAILTAIPDLMFILQRDGTYVDYHARDAALLFAPPSSFIGRTVRDVEAAVRRPVGGAGVAVRRSVEAAQSRRQVHTRRDAAGGGRRRLTLSLPHCAGGPS